MSSEIKTISIRLPINFYGQIKEYVDLQKISVSDFARNAMEKLLEDVLQSSDKTSDDIRQSYDIFREQIQVKDEQIERLQQLLMIKEKTTVELLDEKKQLEDKRGFWQRLLRGRTNLTSMQGG